MKIARLEFNLFSVNTYVVWDEETLETAIIDPGMQTPDECQTLKDFITRNRLQVTSLIATHLHIDHAMGIEYVKTVYDVGLTASPDDAPLGKALSGQAMMFHLRNVPSEAVSIDVPVKNGDSLQVGSSEMRVIGVPGHSPGSIALYSADSGFVVTGDALFNGSIGRTDLPGGDQATLIDSIRTRLLTLPEDTVVYPGHGPATTIGQEKHSNPWI